MDHKAELREVVAKCRGFNLPICPPPVDTDLHRGEGGLISRKNKNVLVTHDLGEEMHNIPLDDIRVPDIGKIGFLIAHQTLPIKLELAILFKCGRSCTGNNIFVELVDS